MTTKRPMPKRPVAKAPSAPVAEPLNLTPAQVPPQPENVSAGQVEATGSKSTAITERVDLLLNDNPIGETAERKRLAERFTRTNGGYLIAGIPGVVLPFTFNANQTIDPIAEDFLYRTYDTVDNVDAEILGFKQFGYDIVISGQEMIHATASGVYLIYEGHAESEAYVVNFIALNGIQDVYKGTAEEPRFRLEPTIQLSMDASIRQEQIKVIQQTFQFTNELS